MDGWMGNGWMGDEWMGDGWMGGWMDGGSIHSLHHHKDFSLHCERECAWSDSDPADGSYADGEFEYYGEDDDDDDGDEDGDEDDGDKDDGEDGDEDDGEKKKKSYEKGEGGGRKNTTVKVTVVDIF